MAARLEVARLNSCSPFSLLCSATPRFTKSWFIERQRLFPFARCVLTTRRCWVVEVLICFWSAQDLFVDRRYFSEIVADGVILATPSGSRLYSRAAGGALVYPFVQVCACRCVNGGACVSFAVRHRLTSSFPRRVISTVLSSGTFESHVTVVQTRPFVIGSRHHTSCWCWRSWAPLLRTGFLLALVLSSVLQRTAPLEQSLLIDGAQARLRESDIIHVMRSPHPLPSIRLWDQPTVDL